MLKNVVVNEWGGKAQIQLNRSSSIEELDEDIEVGSSTSTYFGAMVRHPDRFRPHKTLP